MKKLILIFIITVVFTGCKKSDDGTVEVIPLAPTELKGTIVAEDQIDLSWKDNSTNENGYKIERKNDLGNFSEIGSTAADVTTFSDKTVVINTNYTYRVYNFNQVGKSINYSNEVNIKTIGIPKLTTVAITDITPNGAKSGGNITTDGGSVITARGVVWGTSTNPTIALSTKTSNGTGEGSFSSSINGLTPNTTYYVRAYATSSKGTGYGNQISFNTLIPSIPTLTTIAINSNTCISAISGGSISNDGGDQISQKGVCWSTNPNPTIALNTKTSDGIGAGSFSSNITSLTPQTTYYLRSYATNRGGTGYGDQLTFNTLPYTVPKLTTSSVSTIYSTALISGGDVIFDGCSNVINRGICWSKSPNPTIALSTKTSDGTGTGSFSSSISGLTPNTTYYVRAYSTNSTGTGYGNQITVVTPNTETTSVCNKIWMKRNLDVTTYRNGDPIPQVTDPNQWASLKTGAWCYLNNDPKNGVIYGKLYNWYAVNDPRGLAPVGWHVSANSDWLELIKCLDPGNSTNYSVKVGGLMKEVGTALWIYPNLGATNSSGFTALPGGMRTGDAGSKGYFDDSRNNAFWWSSTPKNPPVEGFKYYIYASSTIITEALTIFSEGLSVRCIKD